MDNNTKMRKQRPIKAFFNITNNLGTPKFRNPTCAPAQDSTLKTTNDGPMAKVAKLEEQTDKQNGESSRPAALQPGTKEEEPHEEPHSFEWSCDDKAQFITCKTLGTIEQTLNSSAEFKKIATKNKNKELVMLKDGKAISSHCPCNLIPKDERLTIYHIKSADKLKQTGGASAPHHRKKPGRELVTFHLLTRGGNKIKRIMKNPRMIDFQEITVYAYKGEKVKAALKRDGRLKKIVFRKNCALSNISTNVTYEMSNLVDDLDGKTFRVKLLNKDIVSDSQTSSLEETDMMQNDSVESCRSQAPPQLSPTTMSMNDNSPKQKPEFGGEKAPVKLWREIPDSKKMLQDLSSKFKELIKAQTLKQPLSRMQNLCRVEYGKNAQTCREVKLMKKMMDHSNSVCQVRINGKPEGSGFLLFDKFVLTNAHVVDTVYDKTTQQLYQTVTVHFCFESLDQTDQSGVAVEEVVGLEYGCDVSGHQYDWALLRLSADEKLPDDLLTHFGFPSKRGGICIIGHPDGGVKKIDPCLIIEDRSEVVQRHRLENPEGVEPHNDHYRESQENIQLVTQRFFEDVENDPEKRQAVQYESCFSFGSSGSPVFDEHCNVVAMHSGGYPYKNARGQAQSVIEYGYALSMIIEHIIVQMVEREKFDVLKEFLACSYERRKNVMTNLKKLVESRNLTAFQNATNNPEVMTNDESLREFFEFMKEEPTAMDTD